MMFAFSAFFVIAVLRCYAIELKPNGPGIKVSCRRYSKSVIPTETEVEWSSDNIYPVQVCGIFSEPVIPCRLGKLIRSRLRLKVKSPTAYQLFDKYFNVKDIVSNKYFCHVFDLCDIVAKFGGIIVPGTKVGLEGAVANWKAVSGKPLLFHVSIRSASYSATEAKTIPLINDDHKLHSVVCNMPNCTVDVNPPYDHIHKQVYSLTKMEGQETLQCKAGSGHITGKTFYVTSFLCNCPREFVISNVTTATTTEGCTMHTISASGVSSTEIPTTSISTIGTSTIGTSTIGTSTIGTSTIGTSTIGTSTIGTSTIGTSTIGTSAIPSIAPPVRSAGVIVGGVFGVALALAAISSGSYAIYRYRTKLKPIFSWYGDIQPSIELKERERGGDTELTTEWI